MSGSSLVPGVPVVFTSMIDTGKVEVVLLGEVAIVGGLYFLLAGVFMPTVVRSLQRRRYARQARRRLQRFGNDLMVRSQEGHDGLGL